jgi:hypothetical protein
MKKLTLLSTTAFLALLILTNCGSDSGIGGDFIGGDRTGKGGSLARFATVENHLFALNNDSLLVYRTADPKNLQYAGKAYGGPDLETMFPRDRNTMFLGAASGMYIMDISNPEAPKRIGVYNHVTSCDPVVADNNYAYVTLRTSSEAWCRWGTNQLDIIDISDLTQPRVVRSQNMSSPMGLAIQGPLLFVCDGGIKVFQKDPANFVMIHHNPNIDAQDIIAGPKSLIVVGKNGVSQLVFSGNTFQEISKL